MYLADKVRMANISADEPAAEQRPASPLFKLPAELRNRIYEYALTDDKQPLVVVHTWLSVSNGYGLCMQPALVRTCRAIRNEALSIFYSSNEFTASFEMQYSERVMRAWLERIGRQNREHLQQILVPVVDFEMYFSMVEAFRRTQTRFLKRVKHSGEKKVGDRYYYVVRLDCLNFDG